MMDEDPDWVQVLPKDKLKQLNKPDLLNYAVKLGANIQLLSKKLFDPESGVLAKLQSQIAISSRVNAVLADRLLRLEKENNRNSQYTRKETIELHRFPDVEQVPNKDLEEKVLSILNNIKDEHDDVYTATDFHACHRLVQKDRVIVKLTHRKRMRAIVKSRGKLADKTTQQELNIGRVFIVESLAGPYKGLLYKCQRLKAVGRVHDAWFYNGNINVVLVEKGARHHISHIMEILDLLNVSEDQLNELIKKLMN